LETSAAPVDEYFYGEGLADVYKENPYNAIAGKNSDGNANTMAPAANDDSMSSKAAVEKIVKNDFRTQAGIDKCLAHLRRGKEKRIVDNQLSKSLEMRFYEPITGSPVTAKDDLDTLAKNGFRFPSDIRNSLKIGNESLQTHRVKAARSPNHRLSSNEVAPVASINSAIPSTDPSTVLWVKSFRSPSSKSNFSFGSTSSSGPQRQRDSFTSNIPIRRASSISFRDTGLTPSKISRTAKAPHGNDTQITAPAPVSGAAAFFAPVGVDPTESSADCFDDGGCLARTEASEAGDIKQDSPSPVSLFSEKSEQSECESTSTKESTGLDKMIEGNSGPSIESLNRGKPVESASEIQKKTIPRKTHQKLIDKYQSVLGIDVDHFDGTADTFKTLVDLKQ
jgi:hypothetical protein